jgi:hypothetical protein
MRKIVTAVSAAALSLSMLASAVPALAVSGFDSAYAGESAFVFISPGQTQNFQVFFANTGTTTWSRGTSTQVDLAACRADKVTCDAIEATNASWNSGWLSTTRYATTTQTTTAPGSLGTFSYNVTAPVGATAGNYRFNGDLVLSTTAEKIHPEGYYQDATIGTGGGAATITSISPVSGKSDGGTSVTITGTGFSCTPAFPAVSFGGTNAAVSSCGGTQVVAVSPAHAPGGVTLTVTNSGAGASNGFTYTYLDLTPPQFTAQATASNVVTLTFSKMVCHPYAAGTNTANTDWTVRNVSAPGTIPIISDTIPNCTTAKDAGATTARLFLGTTPPYTPNNVPPGAFVEVTLNALAGSCATPPSATTRNGNIQDLAGVPCSGNFILAPQAQTATATNPSTNPPTIASATGVTGDTKVTVKFSDAIFCPIAGQPAPGEWTLTSGAGGDPTFTAFATACPTAQNTAATSFKLSTGTTTLPANTTYTLTFTPNGGCPAVGCGTNEITNVFNVSLVDKPGTASVTFTTGAADITPPIIIDADISAKSTGGSDFGFAGDAFILTFNKKMNGGGVTTAASISIQDQDGTTATLQCMTANVTCSWDTALLNLTVKIAVTLTGPNTTPGNACLPLSCQITGGTTPGMAIPFNITAITGIWDASTNANPVNILGSTDRLVEYPSEVGG